MELLGIRQDFQRLFLERNHKEGSLPEKNSSREPEFSRIQGVGRIQMIAGSGLASYRLSPLKEASPVLINPGPEISISK